MDNPFLERAQHIFPQLVEWRRAIHRHPELGYQEFETAKLIADTLNHSGIDVRTGIASTGVIGHLGDRGPMIALRADMDALPIQELNEVSYASQVPGIMHACGHDAHVAMLLGAATLLKDVELDGQVRLVFQPAEEGHDGGGPAAASRMIQEGVLEGVEAIFSLHVEPDLKAGLVDCQDGPIMAASDRFKVNIQGRACHGAHPYKGTDAILLASYVIQALNHIVSRNIPAQESAVVSLGTIHGGTKSNVVSGQVEMSGTIRSFDPRVRETLFQRVEQACSITRSLGGDYELQIFPGYPATINDPALAALVRQVAREILQIDQVPPLMKDMGSEDFAFYAQHIPGVYFRLGTGFPDQPPRAGHNPHFDIDEAALPIGVAVLAEVVCRYLAQLKTDKGR